MSYRTNDPTAQKAALSDARQRPAPWWRKVRRAWPQTNTFERWIYIAMFACVVACALLIRAYSTAWCLVYVVGVVFPVAVSLLVGLTREGLGVLTARRRLRLGQRSRQRRQPYVLRISERLAHAHNGESHLPICTTCGFPGEGPCDL